jgi:hypothetical protein
MIEKNEMDGGTTFAEGRRMQIVLDENGVYKRTEEMGKGTPKASSMDAATKRALAAKEPPIASVPPPDKGDDKNPPGGQAGTGFKTPS